MNGERACIRFDPVRLCCMEAIEQISLQPVFLGHFDGVWFGGSYHFVEGGNLDGDFVLLGPV